jgi:hypothetical protein
MEAPVTKTILTDDLQEILDRIQPDWKACGVYENSADVVTVWCTNDDYVYMVFRLSRSLDARWTLIPLQGFDIGSTMELGFP